MIVAKIMRKDVVMLRPEDAIEVAWHQMRDQRLAELPVAEPTGRLVGMLSEHDLLARLTSRQTPSWWTRLFDDKDRLAADYVRAVGLTVEDLMTVAPAAIVPDASVETAAGLMRRHSLGALPVVANDACIGLVTRADVLDHLSWPAAAAPRTVTDVELECLMQEGIQQEMWTSKHRVTVEAMHGIIRLTGIATGPAERSALLAMARAVPGCAGVEDRLVVCSRAGHREPARVI
jgi:CBS domain-containing protein